MQDNTPVAPVIDENFIKYSQIELEKQRDSHQYDYALQNLQANAQVHTQTLVSNDRINKRGTVLFAIFLALAALFGFAALLLDKEAILSDMLKVIIGAFGGGGFGYVFGVRSQIKNQAQQPPPQGKV